MVMLIGLQFLAGRMAPYGGELLKTSLFEQDEKELARSGGKDNDRVSSPDSRSPG